MTTKSVIRFLIAVSLNFNIVNAQPGALDSSFGENGIALGLDLGYAGSAALQQDGRILIAGQSSSGLLIARYLPTGELDSSFGNNGYKKRKINIGSEDIKLVVLPDDKFIVGCTAWQYLGNDENGDSKYNYDLLLMRFNANGPLDSSFGNNGSARGDFTEYDLEHDMIVQTDGKIIVCGMASGGPFIARYYPDGQPDSSFDKDGYKIYSTNVSFNALAVQPDGKIITGATNSDNFFNTKFQLARYMPDGSADTSFGKNGITVTDFGPHSDVLNTVALQSDGKILAAGRTNLTTDYAKSNMIIARYSADGSLDKTFGANGSFIAAFDTSISFLTALAVQRDGKIIAAGNVFANSNTPGDFVLTRCFQNGQIDSSFGINGKTITDVNGSNDEALSVLIQKNGKIIIGGISDPEGTGANFALAGYKGDPTHPVITRIKKWIINHILHFENEGGDENTLYYAVEKSDNPYNGFIQVVIINRKASQYNDYSFDLSQSSDVTGSHSKTYYRIKVVQKDGSNFYSTPVSDIQSSEIAVNSSSIKIMPNPVEDVLHITELDPSKIYEIKILDEKGTVQSFSKIQSTNNASINTSLLFSGLYFLLIKDEDNNFKSLQFIKR